MIFLVNRFVGVRFDRPVLKLWSSMNITYACSVICAMVLLYHLLFHPRKWDVDLQGRWVGERLPQEAHKSWPPRWPAENRRRLQLREEQEELPICRRQILAVSNTFCATICEHKILIWLMLACFADVINSYWSAGKCLDLVSVWWDLNCTVNHSSSFSPCATWEFVLLKTKVLSPFKRMSGACFH